MNYELVTGICLAVGTGCLLLAGVLFFALEVPALVREMRGKVGSTGEKKIMKEPDILKDAYVETRENMLPGGEKTMRMAEENKLSGAEKTIWRS